MNEYKLIYTYKDGFVGEEIVYAVNRMMAFSIFEDFNYQDVVNVECIRVVDGV